MTLDQLRVLLAIQERGSLQAAARALQISRTTAGHLVDALEHQAGSPLLIRTPQGTRLTAAAEDIAAEAAPLLSQASDLEARLRGEVRQSWGPLRILLPVSLPAMVHAIALRLISEHLPGVPIEVHSFTEPDKDYAEDAHLRLQFGPAPAAGPFRTFLLCRVPVRLVAAPSYLAKHGAPGAPEELSGHRLLLWRLAAGEGNQLPLRGGGWQDTAPALTATDVPLLRVLASQGDGIALAPCPREGLSPPWQHLVEVLPEQVGCEVGLRALIPERLASLSITRTLITVTRELSMLYNADALEWRQER